MVFNTAPVTTIALHLAARLCRVVLIRQPAFGDRFDLQRIGLRAMGGGDQIVMSRFGGLQPGGPFGDVISEASRFAGLS